MRSYLICLIFAFSCVYGSTVVDYAKNSVFNERVTTGSVLRDRRTIKDRVKYNSFKINLRGRKISGLKCSDLKSSVSSTLRSDVRLAGGTSADCTRAINAIPSCRSIYRTSLRGRSVASTYDSVHYGFDLFMRKENDFYNVFYTFYTSKLAGLKREVSFIKCKRRWYGKKRCWTAREVRSSRYSEFDATVHNAINKVARYEALLLIEPHFHPARYSRGYSFRENYEEGPQTYSINDVENEDSPRQSQDVSVSQDVEFMKPTTDYNCSSHSKETIDKYSDIIVHFANNTPAEIQKSAEAEAELMKVGFKEGKVRVFVTLISTNSEVSDPDELPLFPNDTVWLPEKARNVLFEMFTSRTAKSMETLEMLYRVSSENDGLNNGSLAYGNFAVRKEKDVAHVGYVVVMFKERLMSESTKALEKWLQRNTPTNAGKVWLSRGDDGSSNAQLQQSSVATLYRSRAKAVFVEQFQCLVEEVCDTYGAC